MDQRSVDSGSLLDFSNPPRHPLPIPYREILLTAKIMDSIFVQLYSGQPHCQTHGWMGIIH
jgi:hypothetical protein